MGWTSDREALSDEERGELMGVGATIVTDIKQLLRSLSPAIQTEFHYGVKLVLGRAGTKPTRAAWIVLLFTILDLGGSEEAQVKTFIGDCLRDMLQESMMSKYAVLWGFEVAVKEK